MYTHAFITNLAIFLFVIGYGLIILEHATKTNKSAIALIMAGALWIIAGITSSQSGSVSHALTEAGAEVFSIVIFLLTSMAMVEILAHFKFFDMLRYRIQRLGFNDRGQFIILYILTFVLSAFLDNIAIIVVMVQMAKLFFKKKNVLIATAGFVVATNAGGSWSPIGDVTSLMLWSAGKITPLALMRYAALPALVLFVIAGLCFLVMLEENTIDTGETFVIVPSVGESFMIVAAILSFILPLGMGFFGLPPYIGRIIGLGIVWLCSDIIRQVSTRKSLLEIQIGSFLQKTDHASIKFLIGILFSISALDTLGILRIISGLIYGQTPGTHNIYISTAILGLASSVIDNVPLTGLMIKMVSASDPHLWSFAALTLGTGGSILLIGSIAGIVASGMVPSLTFSKYVRIASGPVLLGYVCAIITFFIIS